MKKILLLCLIMLGAITKISGQENRDFSAGIESNSQYYVDDPKTGDFLEDDRFRSNNYIRLDYFILNFYVGAQLESYAPDALLNYAPGFNETNITLYYAGYKTEKIEATVGHFYEQFGSGLILRSWEDRQLGINNAFRGGRIKYAPSSAFDFTAFYAKQRDGFDVSEGDIYAFNSEVNISDLLESENYSLGLEFSYVGRQQDKPDVDPNTPEFNTLTNAFSGRLDYSKGNFFSSIEYIHKSKDAIIQFGQILNAKTGNALQIDLSYAKKGLGINGTFRRLENMSFFSDRNSVGNDFNSNVMNYVPGLTKQHDYLLTNIYVYQGQPQVSFQGSSLMKVGEIGGQIDVFYQFKKKTALGGKYGTKIAMNYSYWAGLKGNYDFDNFDYVTEFLGFGERYFTDFNIEFRKKWSRNWSSIFYYINQYYNQRYVEETFGKVHANIAVAESTYKMSGGKSLRFELQYLWTKDDRKNWIGGTVEFNVNSRWSFYVNDIYNYGSDDPTEKIHYYNIGSGYVFGANRFALNYGRQRGGLICVGGVCRFVPESNGFTANLILTF